MAKKPGKEVAKKKQSAATVYDYGGSGTGFEDTKSDDYAVPFITLLQTNSPQVDENDSRYVKGAKPGMIFNTGTNALNKVVRFIPCCPQHNFVEWIPRDQGGGMVGRWDPEDKKVRDILSSQPFGKYVTDDGNDLVETYYFWGLLVMDDGAIEHALISFKATQIKKYKQWLTRARSLKVPLFAVRWMLTSIQEQNAKGKYFGWVVALDGESIKECLLDPASDEFQQAQGLFALASSGDAKAADEGKVYDAEEEEGDPPF